MLSRDRLEHLRLALNSLGLTSGIRQWIVVDNGSSDGSAAYLERWSSESVGRQVVRNRVDPGPAASRNQGLHLADSDLVLLLDNDVGCVRSDWLDELISAMSSDARVVAAAPTLLFPGSRCLVQSAGGGVTRTGAIGLLYRGMPSETVPPGIQELAWAPAAALLLKRSAVESAGGFDETFDPVALLEDLDLCCRLRSDGKRVVRAPTSVLYHFEGATFQHMDRDLRGYWHRHYMVIRHRWRTTLAAGPFAMPADVAWRPVVKDYSVLDRPKVGLASEAENDRENWSFFRSEKTIPARPPWVRIGVIGCGAVARRGVLPGFSAPGTPSAESAAWFLGFNGCDDSRVVGVADPNVERARAVARDFTVRYAYGSADDLLDLVPLEAVAVCTPAPFLAAEATRALERGVHVLVEKPVATSAMAFDQFLEVRRRFPMQRCAVDMPWCYHPGAMELAKLVESGALGLPSAVSATFLHSGPEHWSSGARWYLDPEAGGIIADMAPHIMGLLQLITGSPVAAVDPRESAARRATADVALQDGAEGRIGIGWDSEVPRFSIRVEGTRGEATAELMSGLLSTRFSGDRQPTTTEVGRPDGAVGHSSAEGPYRAFVSSVQRGYASMIEIDEMATSLRVALQWSDAVFTGSSQR